MTKPMLDSQVLTALADRTLSDKGLADALTGDTMSETRQLVFDALQRLMGAGLVRSYESGGIVWYERVDRGGFVAPIIATAPDTVSPLQAFRDRIATVPRLDIDTEALTPEAQQHVKAALVALHDARQLVEKARVAERVAEIRRLKARAETIPPVK